MPLSPELSVLLDKLIALDKENRVKWQEKSHGSIAVVFPRASVRIWEYNEPDESQGISMSLHDEQGRQVALDSVDSDEEEFPRLHQVYDRARRKTLGLDRVFGNVMRELEKPGVVGAEEAEDDMPF